MSERLFVAVSPEPAVSAALDAALRDARLRAPHLRWVPPERWHITLAFIGSTDRGAEACLAVGVGVEAAASQPFELMLDRRLGTFGGRVLWAGLEASEPLRALAEAERMSLTNAGFALEERAFHPHLTVARAGRRERVPQAVTRVWSAPPRSSRSWTTNEVLLLRSESGPDGPRYARVAVWPLAARGA
ncbi:MAG: RNA 2',3'-cyclic phosphodiesterase [Egibacteraceae bacterium]